MKWIICSVSGYAALFAGVWLHETGHSFLQFMFGCRDNWIIVLAIGRISLYMLYLPLCCLIHTHLSQSAVSHMLIENNIEQTKAAKNVY